MSTLSSMPASSPYRLRRSWRRLRALRGSALSSSASMASSRFLMESAVRFRPRFGFVASTASRYARTARPCVRPSASAFLCSSVIERGPRCAAIEENRTTPFGQKQRTSPGWRLDRVLPVTDQSLHTALGLTDDEYATIERILGREPNHLELAMYAVMWSEHCSYKSSRIHLKRLPTTGEGVLVGPGENAGVMDVGDGIAAAIRIESHNHPSYIEPYQGAATGAGGILRDIFTMGARPIALMDPLRFGPLEDARSRWVAEGVVSGISGYGNSVGVPTVGGEVVFDECYRGNPLVNVLCLGVLPVDRLVLAKATGAGNLAVLLGSSTGRDGIGGGSVLASAGFDEGSEDKRPAVQVGDPFEEKRLIEACLALLDAGLVVGIQDLGGAGLTCAASETAANGKMGMDVDVDVVPRREPGMQAFEVMTSESQECMLAIVRPEDLDAVAELCRRWEVRATVVGLVNTGGRLRILEGGQVVADVP